MFAWYSMAWVLDFLKTIHLLFKTIASADSLDAEFL